MHPCFYINKLTWYRLRWRLPDFHPRQKADGSNERRAKGNREQIAQKGIYLRRGNDINCGIDVVPGVGEEFLHSS